MDKEKLISSPSRTESVSEHEVCTTVDANVSNVEVTDNKNVCCKWRRRVHPNFTVLIVFLAVMIDCMLMTVVDPILPDMMLQMDLEPDKIVGDAFLSGQPPKVNWTTEDDLAQKYALKVSLLVSLKPGLEIIFNIVIGFLVDRVGYRSPMLIGCVFNLAATLSFAYLRNYYLLIVSRTFQAAGSSLSVIGGLTLLAATFTDDKSRTQAASKAFCGVSIGVSGGFALGSIMYQVCGRESPFLVLGTVNIIYSILVVIVVVPNSYSKPKTSLKYVKLLLTDKFIIIALLINFVDNFSLGVFLGTAPSWMLYNLNGQQWNIGLILSVASVFHVSAQFITGKFTEAACHWMFVCFGLWMVALGTFAYPFAGEIWEVLIPECITRIGHGVVIACLNPLLTHIVDVRHNSHYGIINGLYTASYNLAQFIGPNVGGALIKAISFNWLYWGLGISIAAFSFVSCCLKHIGDRCEPEDPCKPDIPVESIDSFSSSDSLDQRVCESEQDPCQS